MSKRTEGHLLLSALALVVASAVGCGDSSGSRSDAGPGPPPAVESVEISIDPGRLTYATGDSITATARAFAADDTRLDPFIEIRWSADPSTAIERTGPHSWTFREQGRVELQACAGTVENDRPVCATRTLAVDDAPPSATLNAPEAGALLVGGSSDEIRVTGEVTDTNGTPRARLNGYRVQLDDQGRFETKIDPEFGVNRLRLVATDGRHRSEATVIREFLWAPSYAPLEITPPERRSSSKPSGHRVAFGLDRALVLDLGQRFFDDGQTPSAPEGVRAITHDVADLLQLVVANADLTTQIPSPAIDSGGTRIDVTSIRTGNPEVVVDVTDDGLQVYIRLPDIVINTDGRAKFQTETIQLTGSIRARMSAVASMRVEKSGSDASVDASVGRVEVSIDALEPGFGSKRANALFELADGIVRNELETRLKEAVRKEFVGTLPTLITEAFSSLQSTLDGRTFSFDSKIAGERKIQVDGSIATLTSARRRSLRSKLKAELATFGDVAHPNSPGVPLTSDEPRSDAPLFARGRLQVGVRLALLNGLLNELWTAGLLELDLSKSDAVPAAVQNAQLSGKLPPVLRPSRRAEPGDLTLEVGHIVLETKLLEQTDTYGVSIRAGLDVGLADGKLEMAIAGEPKLTTWVIATTGEDGALFTPDKLRSLIRSQVLSQLKTAIDKGLSINLPAPDVSGLSSIAPTLSGLKLSFDPERPPALREGWLLFDTRLTGKLGSKSGGN